MSFSPSYRYITGEELAELLRKRPRGVKPGESKDVLVVDVRESDFEGGNIVGCINVPANCFSVEVGDLVKQAKDVDMVVFHCSLSQQRGPKAARIYAEERESLFPPGSDGAKEQKVMVLRGGFAQFVAQYHQDPLLVEKYDKDMWESY